MVTDLMKPEPTKLLLTQAIQIKDGSGTVTSLPGRPQVYKIYDYFILAFSREEARRIWYKTTSHYARRRAEKEKAWKSRATKERQGLLNLDQILEFWNLRIPARAISNWRVIPLHQRKRSNLRGLPHMGTGTVLATDGCVAIWERFDEAIFVKAENCLNINLSMFGRWAKGDDTTKPERSPHRKKTTIEKTVDAMIKAGLASAEQREELITKLEIAANNI